MKNLKTGLLWSTLLASGSVFGQVAAEKEAASPTEVKPYSNVVFRHYTTTAKNADGSESVTPKLRFMPTLGGLFLNGAVDASVTAYIEKHTENTNTTRLTPTGNLTFGGWEAGALSVTPYVDHWFAYEGAASTTNVATSIALGFSADTAAGSLSYGVGVDPWVTFTGRGTETDYKVERKQDQALVAAPETQKGPKKDPDFAHEWNVNATFKPSAIDGLSIGLVTWITNSYEAEYTIKEDGEEESKYLLTQSTLNRLRINYAVTDQLSLRNETYTLQNGIYESAGAFNVQNIAGVIYTLF